MSADASSLKHLEALIGAARAEAERLGPSAARAAELLEEAARCVRGAEARGGRADEGLRPEELTTANDE